MKKDQPGTGNSINFKGLDAGGGPLGIERGRIMQHHGLHGKAPDASSERWGGEKREPKTGVSPKGEGKLP